MSAADTDSDGRPILTQVALAGDEARRQGIVLEDEPESAAPTLPARPAQEDLEQYLRERIEQAVRRALPQATQQTLDKLRKNERWYEDD